MIAVILAVICAYLVGAIPFAYIFGKLIGGIDVREHGSGNVGATNIARTIGKGPGVAVFVLDLLKGTVAVTLIPAIFGRVFPGFMEGRQYALILLGGAAIAGHIWTVFLNFKGGKGVSTTAGVMVGLDPVIFVCAMVIWAVVFFVWKYVSVASIAAAVALPLLAVLTGKDFSFTLFCAVLCMVGVYAHRGNIKRLINGTETRIVKAEKSQ